MKAIRRSSPTGRRPNAGPISCRGEMAEDSAIPGRAKLHRLEENVRVIDVELTNDDLRKVWSTASKFTVHGASELVEKMIGL